MLSLEKPLSRARFLGLGVLLLAVKVSLDLLLSIAFARPFSLLFYFSPTDNPFLALPSTGGSNHAPAASSGYWLTIVGCSLPFLVAGVGLTLRRLRDAGLPGLLAVFFFLPFIKLVFFAVLAAVPTKVITRRTVTDEEGPFRTTTVDLGPNATPESGTRRRWLGVPSSSTPRPTSCGSASSPSPRSPAPTEAIFRIGIAAPLSATIDGEGVGAVRRCKFTTGTFVEPIEVWKPGRELSFSVASQPDPMREWTLYPGPRPRHLDGYLQSTRGQFLLEPLPDGSTRLIGRTWYRVHMEPVPYWRLWGDRIIHTIHMRVLRHVAELAERDVQSG